MSFSILISKFFKVGIITIPNSQMRKLRLKIKKKDLSDITHFTYLTKALSYFLLLLMLWHLGPCWLGGHCLSQGQIIPSDGKHALKSTPFKYKPIYPEPTHCATSSLWLLSPQVHALNNEGPSCSSQPAEIIEAIQPSICLPLIPCLTSSFPWIPRQKAFCPSYPLPPPASHPTLLLPCVALHGILCLLFLGNRK